MKKTIGVLFILLLLILSACGEERSTSTETSSDEALSIYTTVYPVQFFTEQIAGDSVEVTSILPPGTDPHTFEPTTKEMVKLAEADAFIYNGAGLEGYAETISDAVEPEGVTILEASEGIDIEENLHDYEHSGDAEQNEDESHKDEAESHEGHDHADEEESHEDNDHMDEEESDSEKETSEALGEGHEGHNHGGLDPHIWLDPLRSIQMAENVKELLIELKPDQEQVYNENFEQLEKELKELDQDFHEQLEQQPKNDIIVSHAAYGYWEKAYGLHQIAVAGLSPTQEPSQKDLESIIETAGEHDIKHVLFEQNITPKVAEVVQNEIGAEALRIHNLSVLTEENIENEEDYFSLMRENLAQLKVALSE
ncbi:zinc ABC transporter substrate-binding protein [Halobacillus locisalis]|uniref:Zinc ABC transporter substrate-binding protein n=1 Tax=Halobacillus locisalis TaxID=220753 RepID=A0A838CWD4_9BACI|nr:zinc ABC transporter substrate-binding protein [Halobacillus locisalis]MBA2176452.1 zinc ABC transporter substrate-binding protein [Halobacillus locisalis]